LSMYRRLKKLKREVKELDSLIVLLKEFNRQLKAGGISYSGSI
jgi:hypothetical protein